VPTSNDVDAVLANVRRGSDIRFFFDELTLPDWIGPLRDAGLFNSPPGPEREGQYVRYPDWPAARYLARVASAAPKEVFDIIRSIPFTENTRIHDAFTQAALAMPSELAEQLSVDVARWLESTGHLLLLSTHASRLVTQLCEFNKPEAALLLANQLLAIDPPESDGIFARSHAHVGDHEFGRVLAEVSKPLAVAAGLRALRLLTSKMDDALVGRRPLTQVSPPYEDHSNIWRSAISEPRRATRDTEGLLVDATLTVSTVIIEAGGPDAAQVVTLLYNGQWKVLRRIALDLVAIYPEAVDPGIVEEMLLDRTLVQDVTYELEFQRALTANFFRLSSVDAAVYLDVIRTGPLESTEVRKRIGERWNQYVAHWQSKRLVPILEYLAPAERAWAVALVQTNSVESPTAVPRDESVGFVGPTSPLKADQLLAMTLDELLLLLESWEPSGAWAAPSREGLGRALIAAVTQDPRRFAKAAERFVGQQPIFVRSVLVGLREAISGGSRLPWNSILSLCDWVTQQQLDGSGRIWGREDRDPGWGWTWTEIARLLSEGMIKLESGLPRSRAAAVWKLLDSLSKNPDPTDRYEAEFGGNNMDSMTLSINTGRGEALHAVVRYAWWSTRGSGPLPRKVRGLLKYHADPSTERSLAIHSVYGRWLSVLLAVDAAWTTSNSAAIFPSSSALSGYWEAAWESFVLFDRPTPETFSALKGQYRRAFRELHARGDDRHHHDRLQATAAHVASYYLWSLDNIEDETGLLHAFLDEAPPAARVELIRVAGNALRPDAPESEGLSESQVDLLKALWLDRRRAFLDGRASDEEVAAFGWWCGSTYLDPGWWLAQLDWIVSRSIEPDPIFAVLEALPMGAALDPSLAIRVLRKLVEVVKEDWAFLGNFDDVKATISAALGSVDRSTRDVGRQIIHEFGARELGDFSDLL